MKNKNEKVNSESIIDEILKIRPKHEARSPADFLQSIKDKAYTNFVNAIKGMKIDEINYEFDKRLKLFQTEANSLLFKISMEK